MVNASQVKEQILRLFQIRGPSLPVHVAKETGLNSLFASAFLSELYSEQKIKMSNMRVGSSPLYFLPGQENMLEKFSEFLKGKEKEAFALLKVEKFILDKDLEPAIRVALNQIKDFAFKFNKKDFVVWRYFTVLESEFKTDETAEKKVVLEKEILEEESVQKEEKVEAQKDLEIFDKPEKEKPKKTKEKTAVKKTTKKKPQVKAGKKQEEKFLEKVKEFLAKSSTEIVSIEGLKKDELSLKVKTNNEEHLLVAFNKKKISEKEIVKAAKKASDLGLRYSVLSLGELPKKFSDLISALENIKDIGKVE
jgi:hypothetical protein